MTRVAIVGSRKYPNLDAVRAYVRALPPGTVVVSGGARGVDEAAEEEARLCGLPVPEIHYPDYKTHGRYLAPKMRNIAIARSCDRMAAFIHNMSGGTLHAIGCAVVFGKPVEVRTP